MKSAPKFICTTCKSKFVSKDRARDHVAKQHVGGRYATRYNDACEMIASVTDTIVDGVLCWQIVCERHYHCIEVSSKREAMSYISATDEFCEACEDDSEYCYTCEIDIASYLFDNDVALGHEGHEIGGRN